MIHIINDVEDSPFITWEFPIYRWNMFHLSLEDDPFTEREYAFIAGKLIIYGWKEYESITGRLSIYSWKIINFLGNDLGDLTIFQII